MVSKDRRHLLVTPWSALTPCLTPVQCSPLFAFPSLACTSSSIRNFSTLYIKNVENVYRCPKRKRILQNYRTRNLSKHIWPMLLFAVSSKEKNKQKIFTKFTNNEQIYDRQHPSVITFLKGKLQRKNQRDAICIFERQIAEEEPERCHMLEYRP